jgi:CheY-like chemotaxis protein
LEFHSGTDITQDNLVNQRVLQKQLLHLGFVVHVANHGGEALDQLQASTFWQANSDSNDEGSQETQKSPIDISVVLMDQEMPVMDGKECTKRIRELEAEGKFNRHIPIVGVTANARQEQIDDLVKVGMVRTADHLVCLSNANSFSQGRRRIKAIPTSCPCTKS